MAEDIFDGLVAVQLPQGVSMTLLDGIAYSADVYGVVRVSQKQADRLLKDKRYKLAGKRNGKVDPTKSETQKQISEEVAKESLQAEAKMAQPSPATPAIPHK